MPDHPAEPEAISAHAERSQQTSDAWVDDPTDWPTGRLLSTAGRLLEHRWNSELAAHGLTIAGLSVLFVLGPGPLTQRELAARCRVEEQTMSRTVARLERLGQVSRRRDDGDRRRMVVERQPAGAAVLSAATAAARRLEHEVLGEAADSPALRRVLEHVVNKLAQERWWRTPPANQP